VCPDKGAHGSCQSTDFSITVGVMEPTTRRGFLRVTVASAAVVTASVAVRNLVRESVNWSDVVGAPDCPQALDVAALGIENDEQYQVTLVVETPWESLEYRLEDTVLTQGQSRLDVPLIYPYTTYQPGRYSYRARLQSKSTSVETTQSATFELTSYRWFV